MRTAEDPEGLSGAGRGKEALVFARAAHVKEDTKR